MTSDAPVEMGICPDCGHVGNYWPGVWSCLANCKSGGIAIPLSTILKDPQSPENLKALRALKGNQTSFRIFLADSGNPKELKKLLQDL